LDHYFNPKFEEIADLKVYNNLNQKIHSERRISFKEIALIVRRVFKNQIITVSEVQKELFLYYIVPFLHCRGHHITSAILEKDRALMQKEEEVCS